MIRSLFCCVCCFVIIAGCDQAATNEAKSAKLTIAVAASLKPAIDELVADYESANPGEEVRVIYGASGTLYAQIKNGAPFDLFLSADTDYPKQIVAAKLADESDLFSYATGRLVVWVHKDSPIDLERLGFAALLDPSVRKIAIANPKLAPYGKAAEQAISRAGLIEQVKSRFVLGENIAQTAQYMESGAAEIGLIAQSLAMTPKMEEKGRTWVVPGDMHELIVQSGAILAHTKRRDAAKLFRDYLLSANGQAILAKQGFASPVP